MALAKCLVECSRKNQSTILWDELSDSFLQQYVMRPRDNPMPQQGNPNRRTVMERVVMDLSTGSIDYADAVTRVAEQGFEDVVPRFHDYRQRQQNSERTFLHFQIRIETGHQG